MVQAYVTVAKKIALLSLRIQDVFCIVAAMMDLATRRFCNMQPGLHAALGNILINSQLLV